MSGEDHSQRPILEFNTYMTEEEALEEAAKLKRVEAEVIAKYDRMFPKPLKPENEMLWRYLATEPLDKFKWFIENSKIWMTKASQFRDTMEGVFPERSKERWREFDTQMSGSYDDEELEKIFAEQREDKFVSSWAWDHHESLWLWKEYCGKDSGVAIKTTYAKAIAACRAHGINSYQIGRMTYVMDWSTFEVPISNSYWSIMNKDASFRKEKEVRIVILGDPDEDHREMPVDLVELIDEIRVHPLATPEYLDSIKGLASRVDPRLGDRVAWSWLRGHVSEADFSA